MKQDHIENLISKFVQGTLSADEQKTFDRLFESDASFSSRAMEALGQRLGPAPDAFLERMGAAARPSVEEAFRCKMGPAASGTLSFGRNIPWSVVAPVLALIAALGGLLWVASHLVHRGQTEANTLRIENLSPSPLERAKIPEARPAMKKTRPSATTPSTKYAKTKTTREGRWVRFADLPASAHTRIEVLDAQGRCVKRLYDGAWAQGQRLDWDGLGDDGKPVAPGSYQARVKNSRGTFTSSFSVQ